jgi:hypothetical protein
MSAPKYMLDSFRKDKAVQDNIVESWLCVDCGVNTAPGCLSGPELRIALALSSGGVEQTYTRETEVYDVKYSIWKQVGIRPWSGCLCIGCLEERLGRQLRPKDFSRHDRDCWAHLPCTERLLNRRGLASNTAPSFVGFRSERQDVLDWSA